MLCFRSWTRPSSLLHFLFAGRAGDLRELCADVNDDVPIQESSKAGERSDAEEHGRERRIFFAERVLIFSLKFTSRKKNEEDIKGERGMKPAQACPGSSRPARLFSLPASSSHRRPGPLRRCRCSAEVSEEEDRKKATSSSTSPPPPPRPPPPDPEKRWRRLWGGNPHGVYRVPGVSDWFARAPQVRVRSRTDRQVRDCSRSSE